MVLISLIEWLMKLTNVMYWYQTSGNDSNNGAAPF